MNDRFLRACHREAVDATPVWFMRQAGRALPEFRAIRARPRPPPSVAAPALCAEVTLQPVERLGVDAAILFADITTPLPGIGVPLEIVDGVGPVFERPIRTTVDVAALRLFDPEASVGPLLEAIRLVRREARVPLIGFAGAPFTLAAYLVEDRAAGGRPGDARAVKTLLHAERDTYDRLMAALVDMTVAYLRAQAAAGVQAVQLFDSWVGALSPSDYEQAVAPHMDRLFAGLSDLGVPTIHFGTNTAGLLGAMAEAGGDVIGVDWRIGLANAWRMVSDRGIQGNLDPALLLGPFESVAAQTRWILAEAAGRPGHVFNLGHGVLPDTDPDDLRRLVDVVHEASSRASATPSVATPVVAAPSATTPIARGAPRAS